MSRPIGTHAGSIFELFIHMLDPAVNKLGSSVSDDELVTNLLVVSYILSAAWKIRKVMQRLVSDGSVVHFQLLVAIHIFQLSDPSMRSQPGIPQKMTEPINPGWDHR